MTNDAGLRNMNTKAKTVKIVEVGLRDGLQNESVVVDADVRYQLLRQLIDAGLTSLEVGSFVSPKWVPAMAPSEELFKRAIADQKTSIIPANVSLSALVPNEKGMDAVVRLGIKEIAVFAACSETFSQKNTNCSIAESFERLTRVAKVATDHGIKIRGYLSTTFGCPFEGPVNLDLVSKNVKRLLDLGAYEVSLGDTIGIASAGDIETLLGHLFKSVSPHVLAGHFHDTRGQAVANVLMAYQMGIRVFDASIGGLGGCPYAPGATGNVATEDLIYLFDSMNVDSGIDLSLLVKSNHWLAQKMNKKLPSRIGLVDDHQKTKSKACFL